MQQVHLLQANGSRCSDKSKLVGEIKNGRGETATRKEPDTQREAAASRLQRLVAAAGKRGSRTGGRHGRRDPPSALRPVVLPSRCASLSLSLSSWCHTAKQDPCHAGRERRRCPFLRPSTCCKSENVFAANAARPEDGTELSLTALSSRLR